MAWPLYCRAILVRRSPLFPALIRSASGLEETVLIRKNVALRPVTPAAVSGIPWQLYTHNQFTIVNYLELLDKQRPLPLFLVSAKTPGQEKGPLDHYVLTRLPGGQRFRAPGRRREAVSGVVLPGGRPPAADPGSR
jgi:hypothetical protein